MEPGKIVVYRNALYRGKVRVHIVGYRRSAVEETIWLISFPSWQVCS